VGRSPKSVAVLALLLLVALCSSAEVACSPGNWSEWPEYICAKYRWTRWIDGFAEEDYSGMNMVLYPIRTDLNRTIEEARLASVMAEEKGLAFAAGLYYCAGGVVPENFNYSRMVQLGKQEPRVPSLSDDRYWDEAVTKPALALANLSLYYPIYAVLWDIELYGRTFVSRPGYSWDQYSLERFGKEKGMEIPKLNDSERYAWIYNEGIQGEFCRWQREQVFLFASETERLVHEINQFPYCLSIFIRIVFYYSEGHY